MSKKQLQARLERNRELGRLDASNRCHSCKISLLNQPSIQIAGYPEKYCASCYGDFYTEAEREQYKADGV